MYYEKCEGFCVAKEKIMRRLKELEQENKELNRRLTKALELLFDMECEADI